MTAPALPPGSGPHLERRLGLLQATALNMINMIGIGPFITIPILMEKINGGGPQAMLGWLVAILVTVPDGMIWSELGAAYPGSGGSYVYLREGFGRETWGRQVAYQSQFNDASNRAHAGKARIKSRLIGSLDPDPLRTSAMIGRAGMSCEAEPHHSF